MSTSAPSGPVNCLNCRQEFTGNFCSQCGQKSATHRFTVGHVLHELPHQVFHVDKGIFRNVKSILFPRRAVEEYIAGKRIFYFNPLLFFFLSAGLVMFLESKLSDGFALQIHFGGWNSNGFNAGEMLKPYLKYLYFFWAFLYGFSNYLIFRKETSFNYAEQVIAAIFIFGYVNIAYLLVLFTPARGQFPLNFSSMGLLLLFTFLVFYRGNWRKTFFKTLLSMFLLGILFVLTTALIGLTAWQVHRFLN